MKIIAIIEDDRPIGNLPEESLTREGYGGLHHLAGIPFALIRSSAAAVRLSLSVPG